MDFLISSKLYSKINFAVSLVKQSNDYYSVKLTSTEVRHGTAQLQLPPARGPTMMVSSQLFPATWSAAVLLLLVTCLLVQAAAAAPDHGPKRRIGKDHMAARTIRLKILLYSPEFPLN